MKQEIAREPSPDRAGFEVSRLPFSEIPHQSRLFIEYLRDPVSLRRYYPNACPSPAQIESFIPEVLSKYSSDRDKLCDALLEINNAAGSSQKTRDNIKLLREPDTVAIVTGQQAGLFTGPLYTVYKALSAVSLAAKLSKTGIKAVPVFWTASEDHDFEEVSEAFFIHKNGELTLKKYKPESYSEDLPVGSIKIDDKIDETIASIFADIPNTEFSGEIRKLLADCWSNGIYFSEAFAKMLASITGKYGIIFIDPMHAGIKRLSAPIYSLAIENSVEIVSGVISRGRELKNEGFHSQVLVEDDYFPLFWHDDSGRRVALRKTENGEYRAKGGRREFTSSELRQIAMDEPQRFSPGVMLRPVVQDFLLPTACYFGGAAEIAYFAQNSEVYRVLERPVTPVFHRQSFTLAAAKHRRVFEKFDLDLNQLFEGMEKTLLRLAANTFSQDTARLYGEAEEIINTQLNGIDHAVSLIDTTLLANVAKRRRKIIYHIAALRKKTLLAEIRSDEIVARQIGDLFAALLPHGELQERSLNIVTFLNKYGLNFIDWIYEAIDLEDKEHRIIKL